MSKVKNELKNDPLLPSRHTLEHIMHMSVEKLFNGARKVMGPAIENGFYGDFDYSQKISEEDFEKIEAEMRKVIEAKLPVEIKEISIDEAKEIFKDNPYKLEFILDIENRGEKPTICEIGTGDTKYHDIDLCAGPHVKNTGDLDKDSFKLLNVAGAYWRGDEKNKMLTRIYATAFNTKKELTDYLNKIEESKKRDHRKIGQDQELFIFDDEVGQGLPLWLPNGAFIRHKVQEFAFNTYLNRGYKPVITPHIGSQKLWAHSGHVDFYKDSLYDSFGIEDEQYRLKPMNCPMHVRMFKYRPRSYKELPIRWTEMGTVYRYERSGTLHGLTRVRGFTQDDAHIICTPDQLHNELVEAIKLTLYILKSFGFEEFETNLSVRDPNNKSHFIGKDDDWDNAEKALIKAMAEAGFNDYVLDVGGAVFYGPKIDLKVSDAIGRKWQLSTIQFDFNLPGRFDMTYIGEDGKEHTPHMIHRALLGSLERFMGVYIEHTAGSFPVWLVPTQAVIIPIGEKHIEYAKKVAETLKNKNLRVEIDDRSDTMQSKIRDAQMKKIPYMLVVGDREAENNTASVRLRTGENLNAISTSEIAEKISQIDLTKGLNLW
jgi:threonyl-tRNA synthetase